MRPILQISSPFAAVISACSRVPPLNCIQSTREPWTVKRTKSKCAKETAPCFEFGIIYRLSDSINMETTRYDPSYVHAVSGR